MRQFLFAASLVAVSAGGVSAEDAPAPTPVAPPAMSGPTIMAAPVTEYAPMAQPARRGLFARLRNRNAMTYSGAAMPMTMTGPTGTPTMMTGPTGTPTPMPPVAPTPMPGAKSGGTTMMMPGMVIPAGGSMAVPATGNVPAGIYTTTDGTVVRVGGTEMSPAMSSPMTGSTTRGGLFGRLRNR
jgi:hypothetical protein